MLKKYLRFLSLLIIVFTLTSFNLFKIDFEEGKNNNVCRSLQGKSLIYLIFVDTKQTPPWTAFDIQSTMDSLIIAVDWLEMEARARNIKLNFTTDYYIGEEYSTINKRLPDENLLKSITEPNPKKGIENLNNWADKIARSAGSSMKVEEKDGIPLINQPKNKERLIAFLRDKYRVESVCLLYMLNSYFKDEISIALNTYSEKDVEFAIVSNNFSSEIAHNILHIYGAADLHETTWRSDKSNIKYAKQNFPDEIMLDPYARKLNAINISEYTEYLIGWKDSLSKEYINLLKDNISFNIE